MLKEKHAGKFYQVTGKRKIEVFEIDHQGRITDKLLGKRTLPERIRLETLSVREAEIFATDVLKHEGIMCEIHEITR